MDFELMMSLFALGCGGYCAYTWLKLVIGKRLFKNSLLVPSDKRPEDCTDESAYIRYIRPSLGVLSVVTVAYGAFFTISDMMPAPLVPYPWSLVPVAVGMAALVWYAVMNGKANRTFFGGCSQTQNASAVIERQITFRQPNRARCLRLCRRRVLRFSNGLLEKLRRMARG